MLETLFYLITAFLIAAPGNSNSKIGNSCFTAPPKDAVSHCKALLQSRTLSPQSRFFAYMALTDAYAEQNRNDDALETINIALKLDPESSMAFAYRSSLHLGKQNYEAAHIDIDKAIQNDPGEAGYYISKGLIYRRQNKMQNALEQYNTSIKMNPNIALAYNNRAYIYRFMKKYDLANADFLRAYQMDPNDTMIIHSMGELAYEQGDITKAASLWKKVCKLSTTRTKYEIERDLHKLGFLSSQPDKICDDETIEAFKRCAREKCIIGAS